MQGSFDLILCDVPCSGTGTLAGNPEIRHRLKVEELARQAERQRAILKGALKRLAPGGRLVYSTCSLEPEECERVVEAVVGAGGVRTVPVDGLIAELGEQGILLRGVELGSAVRRWGAEDAAGGAWVRWFLCGGAGAGLSESRGGFPRDERTMCARTG